MDVTRESISCILELWEILLSWCPPTIRNIRRITAVWRRQRLGLLSTGTTALLVCGRWSVIWSGPLYPAPQKGCQTLHAVQTSPDHVVIDSSKLVPASPWQRRGHSRQLCLDPVPCCVRTVVVLPSHHKGLHRLVRQSSDSRHSAHFGVKNVVLPRHHKGLHRLVRQCSDSDTLVTLMSRMSSFPATIKDCVDSLDSAVKVTLWSLWCQECNSKNCIDSLDSAVIADTLDTLMSRMSSFPATINDCLDSLDSAVIVTLWSLWCQECNSKNCIDTLHSAVIADTLDTLVSRMPQ